MRGEGQDSLVLVAAAMIGGYMARFKRASIEEMGTMLSDVKIQAKQQLDPAHFSKMERKGLRNIYKQERVKRTQCYRIAAAGVIRATASADMAALICLIRGMLLP
jgi:PiT family inorganic phosphate transporter